MKGIILMFAVVLSSLQIFSQTQPSFTKADERLKSETQRQTLRDNSLVSNMEFRNVGPTIMSGRIVDVAVKESDPSHFYAAYASGGLWFTNNNGTSFTPIFDNQTVMTIGDIAVDWQNNTIWVGTGENNSSRSSYAGTGIYKSTDNGNTWEYKGLPESHHIGRIILHPTNPDIIWVAALGHLYSPNAERGVYKTTDGGNTWTKTLFVYENAGAVDLMINPKNPTELYAAIWERTRRAWDFTESGEGSGIHKSTDGGDNWELITTKKSGFPIGEGVGRIGLDLFNGDNSTVLYAILDNQFRRKDDKEAESKLVLTKEKLEKMSKEAFLKVDKKDIKAYLKENDFPKKYSTEKVISMVKNDDIKPVALVDYLYDANRMLFDTPVIGTEVYKSTDGGKTWTKTHDDFIDNVYYSYGYYFGQIRVSPQDVNKIYIMGVPILRSDDGGQSFVSIQGTNVHADHHALWCNPNRAGHIINGNDGGINISYDDGENWIKCNSPAVGQFYAINVDMAKPYNIYGGLQDNGVWVGSSTYKASDSWHQYGKYPYKSIMGGDGMQIEIDNRDNNTVYTGYQFGNYFRINKATGDRSYITPKHKLGEKPLRFNWQTPIKLSSHNQDIVYFGSNKLHRSFNQGDRFEAISGDLTKGGKKGDVAYGTLTTISESTFQFGLIYTGSDDGLIHVTKDGGKRWENISYKLPQDMWISRVTASSHDKATVYASLNGYRWDDFTAYIYVSTNYGETWERIGTDLPNEPVNVIKEDPENPNILYVGTDHGVYISLNKGKSFMGMADLPDAPVHDLVIHPRDKDLIVGTHGRSIYVTNVDHLQQLNEEILTEKLYAFDVDKVRYSSRWGTSWSQWAKPNTPNIRIPFYVNSATTADITIKTKGGVKLKEMRMTTTKGLNYMDYDLTIAEYAVKSYEKALNKDNRRDETIELEASDDDKFYLKKGKYIIEIKANGETIEKKLDIYIPKRRGNSMPDPEAHEREID
ncbi:MAG: WD40/YVTN/BNR-like repeat-containing protein [Saprospiraceae bacterium]